MTNTNTLTASELAAMGIENDQGWIVTTPKERPLVIYDEPKDIFTRAFLGKTSISHLKLASSGKISPRRIRELFALGIDVPEGTKATAGLATCLKPTAPSLVTIQNHILGELQDLNKWTFGLAQEVDNTTYEINLMLSESEQTFVLRRLMDKENLLLAELATMVLPSDVFQWVNDPISFTQHVAPWIGRYVMMLIPDEDHQLINQSTDYYHHLNALDPSEDFPPENTPLEDRESPCDYPEVTYPSAIVTSRHNRRHRRQAQARVAQRIYHQIANQDLGTQRKHKIESYIRSLRPSPSAIIDYYVNQRGDDPQVAQKLADKTNYENLPMVWITPRQQRVLLDVLKGYEHLHSKFIEAGFLE